MSSYFPTSSLAYTPIGQGAPANVGVLVSPLPSASSAPNYGTVVQMSAGAGQPATKVALYVAVESGASASPCYGIDVVGQWNAGDPKPGGGINSLAVGMNNNNGLPNSGTLSGISMVSGGQYMAGQALFIDSVAASSGWTWGIFVSQGAIPAGGVGLSIGYPTQQAATGGVKTASINVDMQMLQNNPSTCGLKIRRLTDTAPAGNFIQCVTQAGASVFNVNIAGDLNANSLNLTGASVSTSATAGAGSALPATPDGYLMLYINGSLKKIPYYPG